MKIRRRTVVIVGATLTLGIGVIVAIGAGWLLKTRSGSDFVRARFAQFLTSKLHGRVYLGNISGALMSAPLIDSLEVRDASDSVLIATGHVSFEYNLIDFWDKRVAFRNVVIEHPFFHLRRDTAGTWNYKHVFGMDQPPSLNPIAQLPAIGRSLGDLIELDSVTLHNGEFRWTDPWAPAKWLEGAARDSAIAANLADDSSDVKRGPAGLVKARYWRGIEIRATHVRVKHPDSLGVNVVYSRLDVDESDPPFNVRGARGTVLVRQDTVHVVVDQFRLPHSVARAKGILMTKRGLGVRVRIEADTIALSDIAWIYPTLPTEGGGKSSVDIVKDSTNDHIDYVLTNMDVVSTKSQLHGAMTFGAGEQILGITNVDLDLLPVDFKLIEQFNGGPLALPWAGQLRGHVRARGGPLTNFIVDSSAIDFVDGNVPGVVNHLSGKGTLNILRPINTTFYDFAVSTPHFDIRTIQAVNKNFPPYKGFVAGSLRLDSIWTDVRFRDADFRYVPAPEVAGHFTGNGRITDGEKEMLYDVALVADPVVLEAFALSYPKFPFRGVFAGPFTIRGSLSDMYVTGDLVGEGGRIRTSNVHLNGLGPRFAFGGHLDLENIDPSRVLVDRATWQAGLAASVDAEVSGDSIATMQGGLRFKLAPSHWGTTHINEAYGALTFGQGRMSVDSGQLRSSLVNLTGKGALGLRPEIRDSLTVFAELDSLGALREYIAPKLDSIPADSLRGTATAKAVFIGSIDSLDMRLNVRASDLVYGTITSQGASLTAGITDVMRRRAGTVTIAGDTVGLFGSKYSHVTLDAMLSGDNRMRAAGHMVNTSGAVIDGGAGVSWDTVSVRSTIDSLQVLLGARNWRLAHPATIASLASGVTVDSLELRSGDTSSVLVFAVLPKAGEIRGAFSGRAFPLGDIGKLVPVSIPVAGLASFDVNLGGTRDDPLLTFGGRMLDAKVGEARLEGLGLSGDYRNQSLNAKLDYTRAGVTALTAHATLPMNLALRPVPKRLLDKPLAGRLDADSTDMAIIEAFSAEITKATGRVAGSLEFGGTWAKPRVNGALQLSNAGMTIASLGNVRYDDMRGGIHFFGDSMEVDSISIHSGPDPVDRAVTSGHVSFADFHDWRFSMKLVANRFRAINKADVADVEISTAEAEGLRLSGSQTRSVLTGAMVINSGSIFVPESYSKNIIQIQDPDFIAQIDTSMFASRRLMPSTPMLVKNMSVQNVSVSAGDNLWLRSAEANIKLGGELQVQVGTTTRTPDRKPRSQLILTGALSADQGTYKLNYGPLVRVFTVENGGTITFYGDADLNPTVDINALYTVRQYDQRDARPDVRVRAKLSGPLSNIGVALSSPDSLRISNDDLISYLLTGAPSIEIGGRNSDYTNTVARGLITSFGSLLGRRIGTNFDLEFSTAGLESGYVTNANSVARGILAGTRVSTNWRVKDNISLRTDLGLCQFGAGTSFDAVGLFQSVGSHLDWRLAGGRGFSFGLDPATSALLCSDASTARGFVQTPARFGVDFFRNWRR